MPRQILSTFTAPHSVESFRTFLESLGQRGILQEIGRKYDVTVVSKLHSEDVRRLTWLISTTPKKVMKIRDRSRAVAAEASRYAETCSILRHNLDQRYMQARNFLLEQLKAVEPESEEYARLEEHLKQLDEIHPQEIERVIAEPAKKHDQLWQKHLKIEAVFHKVQQRTMCGMWVEAYDISPDSDQLTVDVVYSGISANNAGLIGQKSNALHEILDLVEGQGKEITVPLSAETSVQYEEEIYSAGAVAIDTNIKISNEASLKTNIPDMMDAAGLGRNNSSERPDWFPKTEKALKKYRVAYGIIKKKKKEYKTDYDNGDTNNPKPTINDLRDAISLKLGVAYSARQIRRIIQAGENGWV
ncbi:MAG: hypothetical protein FOGNACKC_03455 [Anaerolineae bacterium]|nr:hypothetical protein [Anaerolineae bacterium]